VSNEVKQMCEVALSLALFIFLGEAKASLPRFYNTWILVISAPRIFHKANFIS